jgi:hypothetical protein
MARPPHTFAATLKAHLKRRYDGEIPQANMLARLFNMRCDKEDAVNEEAVQGWLDGKIEPTGLQLKTLRAWLGL